MVSKPSATALLLLAVISAMATAGVASETCIRSLLAVSPCLPFFRDSGTSEPPEGCCQGLSGIIDDQAMCLCHIINHTLERAIGVTISVGRAMSLFEDVCRLSPPQGFLGRCNSKRGVPPLYACPASSAS